MARNKRQGGADELYKNHLQGTPFRNNPANNRLAIIERMYNRVLTELAVNRFEWTGLPDSVNPRFLEMTLFYRALAVFFYDKDMGKHIALQGGSSGWPNYEMDPIEFTVVGPNYSGRSVPAEDCVPIWANAVRVPDLDIVSIYSQRLADFDRTVEINGRNARQNKYVLTSENQRLTATNINRQIDEGQNGIQVSGPIQDAGMIQAIDLGVDPNTVEKIHIVRTRLWNECMGLLGIENANQDKKERLVADEVGANEDQTLNMRFVNLNERQRACERINKKFGLNVWVEYRSDAEARREAERQIELQERLIPDSEEKEDDNEDEEVK